MNADALKVLQGRYCNSLTEYSRFVTREVHIGDVPMGGNNPIRIQSMTTTDTMDTIGTVEQSIRMIHAGCEYVRITAPSIKEAQNLAEIKKQLRARGYTTPLVADIHFTPNAAEVAARIVEKVRVNPGNYADKKKFDQIDYTDTEYQNELERIYQKFSPLVKVCKEYGTAMRIGTNHGSLSDRIMSRYGDTPRGMVESAMEFMRICEMLNYYELVISMKSSNPQVMVQAYRLLVQTMVAEGMNYPLHLGVTEAGDGEDGRIKSAVGIGTLLEDGLGDTVRVSLTEEPEAEAPVAIALVERYTLRAKGEEKAKSSEELGEKNLSPLTFNLSPTHDPYSYKKRNTYEANAFIGGHMVPRVVVDLSQANLKDPAILTDAGYIYSPLLDKYSMGEQSVDFVYLGDQLPSFNLPGNLKQLYNYRTWQKLADKTLCHPVFTLHEYVEAEDRTSALNLVRLTNADVESEAFGLLPMDKSLVFVLETDQLHGMADQRQFFFKMEELGLDVPVIIKRTYSPSQPSPEGRAFPAHQAGSYRETADPVYYEQLKKFSRENRKQPTKAENILWQFLRNNQTGYKIRRQHAIGQFIADFVSLQKGLVIELDGHHHKLNKEADDERTAVLNHFGFEVLRFSNDKILQAPQHAFEIIKQKLDALPERDKSIFTGEADVSAGEVSPTGGDLEGAVTSLQLYASTDLGALLVDGFGDGIWIDAPGIETKVITSTAFGILQATRSRISKTEYISCPSCGRTLFDLMITTQMIRSRTSHLKGLKIGIMGCIVNGPGEMADADYGYVGSGTDKVTLYRGKEAVKKNISSANALDELIGIIQEDGNWIEPLAD